MLSALQLYSQGEVDQNEGSVAVGQNEGIVAVDPNDDQAGEGLHRHSNETEQEAQDCLFCLALLFLLAPPRDPILLYSALHHRLYLPLPLCLPPPVLDLSTWFGLSDRTDPLSPLLLFASRLSD